MITCFGEILWDVYPEGKRVGGAPFNVAAHLSMLGSASQIISRIGEDKIGDEILEAALHHSVEPIYIQRDDKVQTGRVLVTLDQGGIPSYEIESPAAWDYITATEENKKLIEGSSGLVYGTLALRNDVSRYALMELLKLSPLNICDLNIRQEFYSADLITALLRHTDILKINDEEADLIQALYDIKSDQLYTQLAETFSIDVVIKTLGGKGAEVWSAGQVIKGAPIAIEVKDTVGSGDAFLAAFIHNYIQNNTLQYCIDAACKLGAYVATQSGAIPRYDINEL